MLSLKLFNKKRSDNDVNNYFRYKNMEKDYFLRLSLLLSWSWIFFLLLNSSKSFKIFIEINFSNLNLKTKRCTYVRV
jgi:hypothetical protein